MRSTSTMERLRPRLCWWENVTEIREELRFCSICRASCHGYNTAVMRTDLFARTVQLYHGTEQTHPSHAAWHKRHEAHNPLRCVCVL